MAQASLSVCKGPRGERKGMGVKLGGTDAE